MAITTETAVTMLERPNTTFVSTVSRYMPRKNSRPGSRNVSAGIEKIACGACSLYAI